LYFYLKNKYKVLQQDTFWLSETPEKSTKSWDAAYPRIVTYGLFENIKTKKKIWVLNTHFDHVGVVARQKSAEIILKKIKQLQGKQNLPVVLTGDFNSLKQILGCNRYSKFTRSQQPQHYKTLWRNCHLECIQLQRKTSRPNRFYLHV
jgi:endonuclease/exonuclease/phosphatase family metal-dependent hydrolase